MNTVFIGMGICWINQDCIDGKPGSAGIVPQAIAPRSPFLYLDNISVMAAVPEPQTYGMLPGSLALIGLAVSRCQAAR